jgi:hypothetical protein
MTRTFCQLSAAARLALPAAGAAGLHKLTSRVFRLGSEQATYGDRCQTSRGRNIVAAAPARQASGDQSSDELKQLYRSPKGDIWFHAGDPETGSAFVMHQANAPSGGQVTEIEIGRLFYRVHLIGGVAHKPWRDPSLARRETADAVLLEPGEERAHGPVCHAGSVSFIESI